MTAQQNFPGLDRARSTVPGYNNSEQNRYYPEPVETQPHPEKYAAPQETDFGVDVYNGQQTVQTQVAQNVESHPAYGTMIGAERTPNQLKQDVIDNTQATMTIRRRHFMEASPQR